MNMRYQCAKAHKRERTPSSQPFFLSALTLSFNEKKKKNSQLKKDTIRGQTINITTMIPKILFLAFLAVLIDY